MDPKIMRSCELTKGGSHVYIYLVRMTDKDGSTKYIIDDRYTYTTRRGERVSDEFTATPFFDRDIAIETFKELVRTWL